jgi:hypothetical protein
MDEPAFHTSLLRGLGQLGPAAGSDGTDSGGNSLISGGAEGGTETSQLLGPDGSDPTYTGTILGSGGGGGGTAVGSAASTTGTASSVLSSLTTGNTPLILGAIAVVGGIAAVAYLAHRKTVQGGGKSRSSFGRRSSHRAYARRR